MASRKFKNLNLDNFEGETANASTTTEKEQSNEEVKKASTVKDLTEKLTSESSVNTAFNFKFIPRDKIVFHEENDYPMEAIEELAESILEDGLIHNMEVFYNQEENTYIVDAGEQRTRAIDLLIGKYKDNADDSREYKLYQKNVKPFEVGYPCKVIFQSEPEENTEELDVINTKIRLIKSNEIGRKADPIRTRNHIEELSHLYEERNKFLGKGEKININKKIGDTLNISDRQVQKYKNIGSLIPELKAKFDSAEINLTDGSNYASLSEEEQMQIVKLLDNGEDKKKVNELYEELKKLQLEINSKESQVAEIEKKRKEAEEALANEKANQAEIRKQIKAELQEADPNNEKIADLEKQLAKEQESSKLHSKSLQTIINEKDRQLDDLRKTMELKESVVKEEKKENIEIMRAATAVDMALSELSSSIGFLKNALKTYSNTYATAQTEEKAPDDFKKQVIDMLSKELKNFK